MKKIIALILMPVAGLILTLKEIMDLVIELCEPVG